MRYTAPSQRPPLTSSLNTSRNVCRVKDRQGADQNLNPWSSNLYPSNSLRWSWTRTSPLANPLRTKVRSSKLAKKTSDDTPTILLDTVTARVRCHDVTRLESRAQLTCLDSPHTQHNVLFAARRHITRGSTPPPKNRSTSDVDPLHLKLAAPRLNRENIRSQCAQHPESLAGVAALAGHPFRG
jgi:hypothetical protein